VGLGQIGLGYDLFVDKDDAIYTHSRAFTKHPAFKLIGGVDSSEKRRELFKMHYQLPVFNTVSNALKNLKHVDIVVIANPTVEHGKTLSEVLACIKPKIILCEKPLSYSLGEAKKMVDACNLAGVKLYVNYMRRAAPIAIEIRNWIQRGEINLPIKCVAWYSKGFLHNGSHLFNLLEFWLGGYLRSKLISAGRLWDPEDPEPDVCVEFERGSVVFISAWEEAFSHYTLEILSPSGRLMYAQGGAQITWQKVELDPNFPGYRGLSGAPDFLGDDMSRYQWHVVDQIGNILAGNSSTLCTGDQALATLQAMKKIVRMRKL
jgi:predicted dehydrogenase